MPPTATLIEDGGERRVRFTRSAGVFIGTRHYRIDGATSIEDCFNATGLPEAGQIWSAEYNKVKARVFDPTREPGPIPFYFMRIDYREDSLTQYTADPELKITTTLTQSSTSEMVDREVRDVPNPKKLTNDGRGVPKMLTSISFEYLEFFTELPSIDPYLALSDEPKVNSDAVILKNFVNSGSDITVPAGQLLYAGFAIGQEQGLFTIRHRLERRRDWKNYRPVEDASGKQVIGPDNKGVFEAADVYETASFSVLG